MSAPTQTLVDGSEPKVKKMRSHICLKDAFREQLEGGLLTEAYFNLTDADRKKIDESHGNMFAGYIPMTDEQWETYKRNRLVTYLGTTKQVGDRQLYALVILSKRQPDNTTLLERCLHVFVEREFPLIEERFDIHLEEGSRIPMFWEKQTS